MAENASKYAKPGALFVANSARFYCKPGYCTRKTATGKSSDATENVTQQPRVTHRSSETQRQIIGARGR